MISLLLILLILIAFGILLFLLFFQLKRIKRLAKRKKIIIKSSQPFLKELKFNPDLNTDNWDLHKIRLKKFGRSQYKGLTFFISLENRIYYLSEKGEKVYC